MPSICFVFHCETPPLRVDGQGIADTGKDNPDMAQRPARRGTLGQGQRRPALEGDGDDGDAEQVGRSDGAQFFYFDSLRLFTINLSLAVLFGVDVGFNFSQIYASFFFIP